MRSKYKTKRGQRRDNKPNQNNPETQVNIINLPSRKDVEARLKQIIVGQDDYIRRLTTALYRRFVYGMPTRILVVGSSGSGKTETVEQLANLLNVPYTLEDATAYTEEGYVGCSVSEIVENIMDNSLKQNNTDRINLGLIIIDEIDKKASKDEAGSMDVAGKAVQQSLLKLMDGQKVPVFYEPTNANCSRLVEIDTINLSFICMGAFEGLDKIRANRLGKKTIGFKSGNAVEQLKEYTEEDFIKYGMSKEFIGRFDCIIETNSLKLDDLKNIMESSKISILNFYKEIFKEEGVELVYSEQFINNIAKKAISLNIGARGIKNVANYVFEHIVSELMEKHTYTKCTLDDDIVNDNTKYVLE